MSDKTAPNEDGHYIEVEPGVAIYCEERGEGDSIVIVPGWTFTTEVFEHQVNHLSREHHVVVIDPRSQGRSTITMEGNDYITHAADLGKIIQALKLRDVALIGWSFGALTTWGYVRENGLDNVRCHVCIDMSPTPLSNNEDDWTEGSLDEIAAAFLALRTARGQREYVASYAADVMVQRNLSSHEMTWLVEQSARSPSWVASLLFASGVFSNYMEEAKLLDGERPSLFVVAEHWADVAKGYLKSNCPNTQVAVLGGHMMFWEYPREFNKILDRFVSENRD